MTYSIVAFDRDRDQLGVAVQSHYFCVGAIVPWAEAGVGAVATQAMVERAYGPRGIERMRGGDEAPSVLAALVAEDASSAIRQVAMVDAAGRVAAHTGERCIAEAGHRTGDGWSVQANMMARPGVPDAMAEAFTTTAGAGAPLADALLAALDAAEAAGGDIRGRQSAALLVVDPSVAPAPLIDVRVDDHANPLAELRRLVRMAEAYRTGAPDAPVMADNPELAFWHAVALATDGDAEAARAIFARAAAAGEQWSELLRRLPAAGLASDVVVRALLTEGGLDGI